MPCGHHISVDFSDSKAAIGDVGLEPSGDMPLEWSELASRGVARSSASAS